MRRMAILVVIYSNSICGARSNFEGGPSALPPVLLVTRPATVCTRMNIVARRAASVFSSNLRG